MSESRRTYFGLCHPRCESLPIYREMLQSPVGSPELYSQYPLVTIHPETAAALNLNEGDWIRVVSPKDSVRMLLRTSDTVDPRMADAEHGWWFPEREEAEPELFGVFESNVNVLCPDDSKYCNPEIGGWPHTALLCRIEKE